MRRSAIWARAAASGLAAVLLALALPAQADIPASGAPGSGTGSGKKTLADQNLRRLDIMLMVTGLRCRTTADDFQADFQAFEARHLAELNAAARDMVAEYSAQMSADEANRLVDRLSVQMANRYGNGHPWLGCHELKGLAQALAGADGREVLVQAASEVLDGDAPPPMLSAPLIAIANQTRLP